MGWSTSIHIATLDVGKAESLLRRLQEHNCLIGVSGDNWVGIYDKRCEETGGIATPKLACQLSKGLNEYVLATCLNEEEFKYWLLRDGKLIDRYPSEKVAFFFSGRSKKHELLNLAKNTELRQQLEVALIPKVRKKPHEILGVTEQEFIADSSRELARVHLMSPDERQRMEEKYSRIRSPHENDFRMLLEAVGITDGDWNYSDLVELENSAEGKDVWARMNLRYT